MLGAKQWLSTHEAENKNSRHLHRTNTKTISNQMDIKMNSPHTTDIVGVKFVRAPMDEDG